MMRSSLTVLFSLVAFAFLAAVGSHVDAADSPIGTWLKKAEGGKPEMTMTVEAWGNGKGKLTYRIKGTDFVLTVVSALDGSDAEVLINGKPSGETMAIKLIDKRHSTTVVKMNGKPFGTSNGTFSEDFKTLNVDNDFSAAAGGYTTGKSTEVWVRE
jgi:hypothetical protein